MEPSPIRVEYPARPLEPTRLQFLRERKKGIGGSDVAAILGLSPWKSPLEVYLDKTDEEDVEDRDNEYMLWGTVLEDDVAREAARRLGLEVRRVNQTLVHNDAPWRMANIDRRIVDPGSDLLAMEWVPDALKREDRRIRMGMECKCVNAFQAKDWMDEGIPLLYQAQCQWYLHVTGWDMWIMAALFGGNHLGMWNVLPDPEAQEALVEKVDAFWHDHVEARVPPEPGPSDADAKLVAKLYPRNDPGKEVPYEDHARDIDHWRRVYLQTNAEINSLESDKQEAANRIKHIMRDGEVMLLPDGAKISWKCNRPSMRLDFDRLKADYPEVFEECSEEVAGARVLRVGRPKKSKSNSK